MKDTWIAFGDGPMRAVKNLGWLHRNLRHVHSVTFAPSASGGFTLRAEGAKPHGRQHWYSRPVPFVYFTTYASREVFETLERPLLEKHGVPVNA